MHAIFGATGSVGKNLAAEWAKSGIPFRVVSRSEERMRRAFGRYGELVDYCVADLGNPAAARSAATLREWSGPAIARPNALPLQSQFLGGQFRTDHAGMNLCEGRIAPPRSIVAEGSESAVVRRSELCQRDIFGGFEHAVSHLF